MSGKAKLNVALQQKGLKPNFTKKRRKVSGEDNEWVAEEMQKEIDYYIKAHIENLVEMMMSTAMWKNTNSSLDAMNSEIAELTNANKDLKKRLTIAEGRITRAKKEIGDLQEKVLGLTTRSMRDNLVFKNMPEDDKEPPHVTRDKVNDFISDKLNISQEDMKKVTIERLHRVGKPVGGKNRKIVAKFSTEGKGIVMQHLKNLSKQSEVKVSQQFPPEVHARRDKLWNQFIDAKKANLKPKWNIDQLQIGDKIVRPPKDTIRDINQDSTQVAMNLEARHTHIKTINKSHFQGHVVNIKNIDDVIPALKTLQRDQRVSGATHMMYAYRVGNDNFSIQNWEDDGEWGGARKIMEVIQGEEVYNKLICVTRWYGGQNIGGTRFDTISEMANEALRLKDKPIPVAEDWAAEGLQGGTGAFT